MKYEWKKHEKKRVTAFIHGILLILAGVLLILGYRDSTEFIFVLGLLFIIYAVVAIILYLFNRYNSFEETLLSFIGGVLALILGILLIMSPSAAGVMVEVVLSAGFILTGLIYLLNMYTYGKERDTMWIASLFIAVVSISCGIIIWIYVPFWDFLISMIIPVYLILLGIFTIGGQFFRGEDLPSIPLPMLAEVFLPSDLIVQLDSFSRERYKEAKVSSDTVGDVEILIHLLKHSDMFWGHVDIAFGNYVVTYGNYDLSKESKRLGGLLGDGVFAICPREEYINFSITKAKKTIFGYQISLNEDQKKIFVDNTKHFLTYCVPWEPKEKDKAVSIFSWEMKKRGGYLYKVTKPPFKRFSGVSTNCALLAEFLLKGTSVPRARSIGGIVTPGAMFSLLEKEFYRKGSLVVARNEYIQHKRII